MNNFKEGDKVICLHVDPSLNYTLTVGKIYTIGGKFYRTEFPENICVEEDDRGKPNGWSIKCTRFELAQPYLQKEEAKKLLGLK